MDIGPRALGDRQLIQSYGEGRFRISGTVHDGGVLVFPERTLPWPVASIRSVTVDSLAEVTAAEPAVEILLLGCGSRFETIPAALKEALRKAGVMVDSMGTGAACRTYNVLVSEGRRVAAALIAID
jgi:uncharacterized protein